MSSGESCITKREFQQRGRKSELEPNRNNGVEEQDNGI